MDSRNKPAVLQERYSYSQTTIKTLFKVYCADGGELPRTTLHHGNWWYEPMVYCHVGDKLVDLDWLSMIGNEYFLTLKGLELLNSHLYQYHTPKEALDLWIATQNPIPVECDRTKFKCDHERYSYWHYWEDMIPEILNDHTNKESKFQMGSGMCKVACIMYASRYMLIHGFKPEVSIEDFYKLTNNIHKNEE